MTNLHTCLERAIQAGEVEADRARAAQEEFDQLVARHSQVMPLHQAEATAAAQLKEATRRARRSRRHMVLNQLQSMTRIQHLVRTSKHPDRALWALLESVSYDGFSGESVRWVSDALQDRIRNHLKDALSDTGQNVFGRSRDVVLFQDVVRELHLQPTGNPVAKAHAVRAVQGEKTYLGRDISNLIRYNTPVASSLWYARKAFDAAIADQLQLLLDPDAQANMRRQERKRDKAFGNTSWWNRGDLLPSKAPDLRNALNGRE